MSKQNEIAGIFTDFGNMLMKDSFEARAEKRRQNLLSELRREEMGLEHGYRTEEDEAQHGYKLDEQAANSGLLEEQETHKQAGRMELEQLRGDNEVREERVENERWGKRYGDKASTRVPFALKSQFEELEDRRNAAKEIIKDPSYTAEDVEYQDAQELLRSTAPKYDYLGEMVSLIGAGEGDKAKALSEKVKAELERKKKLKGTVGAARAAKTAIDEASVPADNTGDAGVIDPAPAEGVAFLAQTVERSMNGQIGQDEIPEVLAKLQAIPKYSLTKAQLTDMVRLEKWLNHSVQK